MTIPCKSRFQRLGAVTKSLRQATSHSNMAVPPPPRPQHHHPRRHPRPRVAPHPHRHLRRSGSELEIPLKIGRLSAAVLLGRCISNHVLTTVSPSSHHVFTSRFFASVVFQLPKISADKPNKANKEPETHHNSPQTPKTRFTHSKVVGPQLLT